METTELKQFFEDNGFNVHLSEENDVPCAEIEKWTDGGVDMIIWLNPFTIEEFKGRIEDFDIDAEIDLHRQAADYRGAFTISESLKDFTDFHNHLKEVASKL